MKKRKWLIENNFQLKIVRLLILLLFLFFLVNVTFFEYYYQRSLNNIENFLIQTEKISAQKENPSNLDNVKLEIQNSFKKIIERFEMFSLTTVYMIIIFIIFCIIMVIYVIMTTQKIVGPFLILKNMLINLMEQDSIKLRELRKGDYFKEHFENVNMVIKEYNNKKNEKNLNSDKKLLL